MKRLRAIFKRAEVTDPPCIGCKDPKRPPVPESLLRQPTDRSPSRERFEPKWRGEPRQ